MNKFKCGNCGAIRYEVDNVVAVKCMECDSSECYGPLKAQTAPVAEVPCSDGLCWVDIAGEKPTKDGLYIVRWPNGMIDETPIEAIQSWGEHKIDLLWLGPLPKPPTT